MGELFSMKGRMNRAKYILYAILISLVTFGIGGAIMGAGMAAGIAAAVSSADATNPDAAAAVAASSFGMGMILAWLLMLVGTVLTGFQAVKRWHDLGKSGAWFWGSLVPILNIYCLIMLVFVKGTTGDNTYGPDPLAGKA